MLQKAIAVEPNALEAQRGLVALDLKKDDVSHALEIARQVQRQRPKQAIGYILEGDIYASRKSWKEALASYRAGLTQAGTVNGSHLL
jgi:predicted negative regulator of RcsB-dependent stress response